MRHERRFELDCTSAPLQAALTLGATRWALAPLIDLVAAALAESNVGPARFSLQVHELPPAHDVQTLRLRIREAVAAKARYTVEYRARGAEDWRACVEGDVYIVGPRGRDGRHGTPPEPAAVSARILRGDLALTERIRKQCASYALHPDLLAPALHAAARALTRETGAARGAALLRVAAIEVQRRGAVPVAFVIEDYVADGQLSATVQLFDDAGQVVARLWGLSTERAASNDVEEPLTLEQLRELAELCLGQTLADDTHLLQTGASSIDLVRLSNAVFEHTRVALSLGDLLAHPTLEAIHELITREEPRPQRALCKLLDDIVARDGAGEPQPESELPSLSRALWLASCLPNAADSYIERCAFRLRGPLDVQALQRAWLTLASRHESLRSRIVQRAGHFYQQLLPVSAAALALRDARASELEAQLAADRGAPLPTGAPFVRASLLRLDREDHVLSIVGHHALCDGHSLRERLLPALARAYRGAPPTQGEAPAALQPRHLTQLEAQPRFQAEAERVAALWRAQLADAPGANELTSALAPEHDGSARGAIRPFAVQASTTARLRELAQRERCSWFVLTLSVFRAALYRFCQLEDLLIGVPIAQSWSPHFRAAAGCLVDFVPLRLRAARDHSLRELMQRAREPLVWAIEHQHAPYAYASAASADGWTPPSIDVGFSCEAGALALDLPGVRAELVDAPPTHVKLPLFMRLEDTGDQLLGRLEYRAGAFDDATIARFAERYTQLLDELEQHLDTPLCELPWLSAAERALALHHATGPTLATPDSALVLIADAIRANPHTFAVIDAQRRLTYAQLDAHADALAARLRSQRPPQRVALYLDAGLELPVAMLAALRAGVCFVPIDPDQPSARVRTLLANAQIERVITLRERADEPALQGCERICIDVSPASLSPRAHTEPRAVPDVTAQTLAYGIFTSGSTGTPKLALATHAGITNKIHAQRALFQLRPGLRVLQFASPAFDAAFSEVVLALASGCTLVSIDARARYSGAALASLLTRECIQVAMLTPSVLAGLPETELPELELLLVVGERCSAELAERWSNGRRMWNLYGPAETSVWATAQRCAPAGGTPSIGRAIPNVRAYVLDRDQNLLPPGQAGEICIAGAAVGAGYFGAPELTRARFVPDPYAADGGGVMYRTGDRGAYAANGQLHFLGRQDEQVKLRGRRIELGEIEAALRGCAGVREAVALLVAPDSPDAHLVGYVTLASAEVQDEHSLRAALRERLPSYAVPARLLVLRDWPRLTGGKIDRKRLRALAAEHSRPPRSRPEAPLERAVAGALAATLRLDPGAVDLDSDFFALGGHSLVAVNFADELERATGVALPLSELLANPSVRALSTRLAARQQHAPHAAADQHTDALARDSRLELPALPEQRARETWKTVLLTGATSGLGRELLVALLRDTQADVVCLVRGAHELEANARILRALDECPEVSRVARQRVRAVCGALERPRLGLGSARYAWLSREVDVIFHAAAEVNLLAPYSQLRAVNVEGTRRLIELACSERVKELHYVSSLSAVFPRHGSRPRLLEERLGPSPARVLLGYGQSKAVSERLLSAAADGGLPVKIYRPSRVYCLRGGLTRNTKDVLVGLLRAAAQLGQYPEFAGDDNLIAADYAASSIVTIARQRRLGARYFHIANPQGTPLALFVHALGARGRALRPVAYAEFCRALHTTELAPLAELLRCNEQLAQELPRVSVHNTQAALQGAGLQCPAVDQTWIERHLDELVPRGGSVVHLQPELTRARPASAPISPERLEAERRHL